MIVQTFASLGVFLVALLPGALYIWGFERYVGLWGIRLSDRLIRFVGVSAVFHVAFLPVTYNFWDQYIRSGSLGEGRAIWAVWPLCLGYVILPLAVGTVIGRGTLSGARWAEIFTGLDPAPRAWDYLFGYRPDGWIRLRLKSGIWIGGAYAVTSDGRRSYAAGYPEPQDLLLVQTAEVDPASGRFLFDDDGSIKLRESSVLIRWDEVEYLEFIEA